MRVIRPPARYATKRVKMVKPLHDITASNFVLQQHLGGQVPAAWLVEKAGRQALVGGLRLKWRAYQYCNF